MMKVLQYILLFLFLLAGGLGALVGWKRRWRRAAVSGLFTLGAFLLALLSVPLFLTGLPKTVTNLVLVKGALDESLELRLFSAPAFAALGKMLERALLGPLVFFFVFGILRLLFLIPDLIIRHKMKEKETEEYRASGQARGIGLAVGILSALLLAFSLLFPAMSYGGMAADAENSLDEVTLEEAADAVGAKETLRLLPEGGSAGPVYTGCVKPILRSWTTVEAYGEKTDLFRFGSDCLSMVRSFVQLPEEDDVPAKERIPRLLDFVADVSDNRLLSQAAVEIISLAADDSELIGELRKELLKNSDSKLAEETLLLFQGLDRRISVLRAGSEEKIAAEHKAYHDILDNLETFLLSLYGEDGKNKDYSRIDGGALGSALETMNGTVMLEGLGEKVVHLLLATEEGELQKYISDTDKLEKDLCSALDKKDGSFANILESALKAAAIVEELNADTADTSRIAEQMVWLSENMTEETAGTVKLAVSTAAFSEVMGASAAKAIGNAVENLCEKLAKSQALQKENGAKESKALLMLYSIGNNVSKENLRGDLFDNVLPSAPELVETICDSSLVSEVVKEMVYASDGTEVAQPLGENVSLGAADHEKLDNALDAYRTAHPECEEKLLNAIRRLFGS